MAQKLFTTFRAAVESFPLGEQNIGLIKPGRYNGYDIFNKTGGLTFRLSHSGSISKTKKDGTPDNQFGAIIMPTGIVIHESDTIDLLVTTNSGNANMREDLVICEHDYQEVQNGTPANYSVVKGPMDGSKPTLPNPEKQVIVGRITITPGGYTEDDISYKKETANLPGDLTYNELLQLLNESLNISDATETVKGIARLATNAEAQAGTDDKTIVTPKSLSTVTSTETRKGLTRKSTDAEVLAGTNNDAYVTPKQIEFGSQLADTRSFQEYQITFATPFTSVPFITVSSAIQEDVLVWKARNVTTTGFLLEGNGAWSSEFIGDVNWKAEEK